MITFPLLIFSITALLGSLVIISHLKSDVDTAWRKFDSEVENVNFLTEELRQNLTELRHRQKRQSYYETTAKYGIFKWYLQNFRYFQFYVAFEKLGWVKLKFQLLEILSCYLI